MTIVLFYKKEWNLNSIGFYFLIIIYLKPSIFQARSHCPIIFLHFYKMHFNISITEMKELGLGDAE